MTKTKPHLYWPPVWGVGTPARHSGRNNKPIDRVVIHSAVMQCKPGAARMLAEWNRSGTTGGSWHYAVDPKTAYQCSWDSWVCHHAPPNPRSLGIEMADQPATGPQGRARWDDAAHLDMEDLTAYLVATITIAYRLPPYYRGPIALRLGRRGVTTHHAVSRAWRQSTHWDPGAWRRLRFMRKVRRLRRGIIAGTITPPAGWVKGEPVAA